MFKLKVIFEFHPQSLVYHNMTISTYNKNNVMLNVHVNVYVNGYNCYIMKFVCMYIYSDYCGTLRRISLRSCIKIHLFPTRRTATDDT